MRVNPIVRFIREILNNGLEAFGRYYSSYRGIVSDNADPKGLGRVKLVIPEITGNDDHDYWAFPKNRFAGQGYGSSITPQIGEMVWVEFEQGHVEVPIFSLGYHGDKELPDDDDCKDPNVYWFFSPNGHKVKINDTKNTIRIESRFGDALEINEKGISVIVDTKKKRQISLGKKDKSTYKAVLGDKVQDMMSDVNKLNSTLIGAIEKDAIGSAVSLGKTALIASMPQLKLLSAAIDLKSKALLSEIVTLE